MMYYAYKSRDGHVYCIRTLAPELDGDYLMFDSVAECVEYWKAQGVIIDRFA